MKHMATYFSLKKMFEIKNYYEVLEEISFTRDTFT